MPPGTNPGDPENACVGTGPPGWSPQHGAGGQHGAAATRGGGGVVQWWQELQPAASSAAASPSPAQTKRMFMMFLLYGWNPPRPRGAVGTRYGQ